MVTKKDIIYLLVIAGLLAIMYVQYSHYQHDSYTRVMDCFRDEVKEPEFCKKFYKQYLE